MTSARRFAGEAARVAAPPEVEGAAPPVLAVFQIATAVAAPEYVSRLRTTLKATLSATVTSGFDVETIPETGLPDWFRDVTSGKAGTGRDPVATAGSGQYVARTGDEPWQLQEWLFAFDPDLRAWAWWDATGGTDADGTVRLWADSSGEPAFPRDELRWLAYVSGAIEVDEPLIRPISAWREARMTSAV